MNRIIKTTCLFFALFVIQGQLHARTYGFLVEAIREHRDNPNLETKANLEAAQRKARVIDFAFLAIPLGIGTYVFIRLSQGMNKNTPKRKTLE